MSRFVGIVLSNECVGDKVTNEYKYSVLMEYYCTGVPAVMYIL